MRRLGLFGGTFDPIHTGHLAAARSAAATLGLDRVIFIPAGDPPGKSRSDISDGAHRLEMVRLAIGDDPLFAATDLETSRTGKSYTVDTVRELRRRHPDAELFFLLGADCAPRVPHWRGYDDLRTMLRFVVWARPGAVETADDLPFLRVACPPFDVSSTQIRARAAAGEALDGLTPASVADYVRRHELYGAHARIARTLSKITPRIVACSGGVDSMLLATLAHRAAPTATIIAHAVSPAVPPAATDRVRAWAQAENWTLHIVSSGEFADENYLSNPVNRCYFCKSNLYGALSDIAAAMPAGAAILSGANTDDLGEYRPGLDAAAERGVRHPMIEAGISKAEIRAVARALGLPFAELAASPCLASRLYTGTRVTASRLAAVDAAETLIRRQTGLAVVRCRVRNDAMVVEVPADDRTQLDASVLDDALAAARTHAPELTGIGLDAAPYRPGRAFVRPPTEPQA